MNTAPENSSESPERVPRDRTFENIITSLNRGQSLLKIAGDFSASALEKLEVLRISQLANPDTLTAIDIYDRPLKEVTHLLNSKNIELVTSPVTKEEAYSLRNIGATIRNLPPSSRVELLIYQERVVGIRVL